MKLLKAKLEFTMHGQLFNRIYIYIILGIISNLEVI